MSFVLFLTIFTVLSVLAVLLLGLFSMMRGGELNKKYGNKLMIARVVLQAIAILLLMLLWIVSSQSS